MILETVCVGPLEVNCYIVAEHEDGHAIIIDPGSEERKIKKVLEKYKLKPGFVINTHGHYDHIGSDDGFNVPVYVYEKEVDFLRDPNLNLSGIFSKPSWVKAEIRPVKDADILELGGICLKVLHIPGHTPGGIALLMTAPQGNIVFTGDTLFCRGIGRSDLNGGDGAILIKTIKQKLMSLSDETIVYPGHGPSTTIGEERLDNPFLD
ncbi:MAG: MBL fold metallo-hydrolase [Candidatus Omnitrophica bacterium]|nr:MBL fold metallo-hydrolase [Candidatus Omnitrophota bacterium]